MVFLSMETQDVIWLLTEQNLMVKLILLFQQASYKFCCIDTNVQNLDSQLI